MKHFYFLILILVSQITMAQDASIFDNNWYLSNLIIDGKDNIPPSNSEVQSILLEFNKEQKTLATNVCNAGYGENVIFSSENNTFTFDVFYQTLGMCNNESNGYFEQLYFPFFSENTAPSVFSYEISETDGVKTLVINANKEQAIYTNQHLATHRFKNSLFSFYPNPTCDIINISFKDKNTISAKVNLYDSLGKLCLNQNLDAEHTAINIQNFKKGFYFLKIETKDAIETQKIVVN